MGAVVWVQVDPESVEMQMGPLVPVRPPAPATNRVPSADEATANHASTGAFEACNQVAPELVERNIPPPGVTPTNLLPSADEAMEFQVVKGLGRLFDVQVIPEFVEV